MERLGSLDAVFLAIETQTCPMNIGQVSIFEGPAPDFADLRAELAWRVARIPRCRQRVRESWHRLTRPVWVHDTGFDIADHVHHATLPAGTDGALEEFVQRVMMVPLRRDRALWEMWVLDDVGDGRWAVVATMHHCVVDGIAGTDLLGALLRDPDQATAEPSEPAGESASEPTAADVARFTLAAVLRSNWARLRRVVAMAVHPARTWQRWRRIGAGARAMWLQPARHDSPVRGPIGPLRRWVHTALPLADIATVRRAHGGTVNDVVLTATALGFADLLRARGVEVAGRDLMALVPVSMRAPDEHGLFDNRVAVTHALLPVGIDDPLETLAAVHAHLEQVKASHQTDASTVVLHSGDMAPNRLAGAIARGVVRAQRNLDTVVTNVPGPRQPLYLCGRRMVEGLPFAPIAGEIRIVVGVWSYCGTLYVGVTGDGDGAADVDVLATGIDRAMEHLFELSRPSP